MKNLILVFFSVITLIACGNKNSATEKLKMTNVELAPLPSDAKMEFNKQATTEKIVNDGTRKIIKEGEINFETKNITATRNAIYHSLKKLGGYIAQENESNDSSDTRKMYVLRARIPENNFEQFLENVVCSLA